MNGHATRGTQVARAMQSRQADPALREGVLSVTTEDGCAPAKEMPARRPAQPAERDCGSNRGGR